MDTSSARRLPDERLPPPARPARSRRKCHGRRNLRRLRKRCRKRGMNEEAIAQFVKDRNQTTSIPIVTVTNEHVTSNENMETTIVLNDISDDTTLVTSHKRKQMTPSSSQRSLSQLSVRKKMMTEERQEPEPEQQPEEVIVEPTATDDRLPMYLKSSPTALFQALRLHVKRSLRKKNERLFIHSRLQLLDRQYRLDLHRDLWQSYSTIGSAQHIWPVS
jgi:DNA-binding transcriptional MerR regulator